MLIDGARHLRRLSGRESILAAHDALKAGVLDHHLSGEVRLGQVGGAHGELGLLRRQTHHRGELGDELLEPADFVEDGAELLLEGQGVETGEEVLQRLLRVLLVEVLGVGEAGANDLCIPVPHDVQVLVAPISYGHEVREHLALFA